MHIFLSEFKSFWFVAILFIGAILSASIYLYSKSKGKNDVPGAILRAMTWTVFIASVVSAVVMTYALHESNNTPLKIEHNVTSENNTSVLMVNTSEKESLDFYMSPILIILSSLAIFWVIKIEYDKLDNERKHYREQAKDNLQDVLTYADALLQRIDKKQIDFFISNKELSRIADGLKIDVSVFGKLDLQDYIDLLPLFFTKLGGDNSKLRSGKPRKENTTYIFSYRFLKIMYHLYEIEKYDAGNDSRWKKLRVLFQYNDDVNKDKKIGNIIQKVYLKALAKNAAQQLKINSSRQHNSEDIGHDLSRLKEMIEEILLKKDFNISENNNIIEGFLNIIELIHKFNDIQSGRYTRYILEHKEIEKKQTYSNILNDGNKQDFNSSNLIENQRLEILEEPLIVTEETSLEDNEQHKDFFTKIESIVKNHEILNMDSESLIKLFENLRDQLQKMTYSKEQSNKLKGFIVAINEDFKVLLIKNMKDSKHTKEVVSKVSHLKKDIDNLMNNVIKEVAIKSLTKNLTSSKRQVVERDEEDKYKEDKATISKLHGTGYIDTMEEILEQFRKESNNVNENVYYSFLAALNFEENWAYISSETLYVFLKKSKSHLEQDLFAETDKIEFNDFFFFFEALWKNGESISMYLKQYNDERIKAGVVPPLDPQNVSYENLYKYAKYGFAMLQNIYADVTAYEIYFDLYKNIDKMRYQLINGSQFVSKETIRKDIFELDGQVYKQCFKKENVQQYSGLLETFFYEACNRPDEEIYEISKKIIEKEDGTIIYGAYDYFVQKWLRYLESNFIMENIFQESKKTLSQYLETGSVHKDELTKLFNKVFTSSVS